MNSKLKNTYKQYLDILEKNSTCSRVKVAAIIVKDGRTISTGWNGVPSGFEHCDEIFKKVVPFGGTPTYTYKNGTRLTQDQYLSLHHDFSEQYEAHAEMNALAFAAKNSISTEGASIFITITPCSNCAKLIIQSGIKKVYYKSVYDRSACGYDLLVEASNKGMIELEKL